MGPGENIEGLAPVSVVIPTYNGRELLARHLPSVLAAAGAYRGRAEVIVVDDGSADGSARWLGEAFPGVRVISLPENRGFARAANRGVEAALHPLVMLLNNDVTVEEDFLGPLVERMGDPGIFSAAALMRDPDNPERVESITRLGWEMGFLDTVWPSRSEVEVFPDGGEIFYACGGAAMYRRELFLGLRGFETIYHPFYWEDADLCYRAWKMGLRSVVCREAVVWHRPGRTIKKVTQSQRRELILERNRLIFQWRNISDPDMLLVHFYWLFRHFFWLVRERNRPKLRSWASALAMLPLARTRLLRDAARQVLSDRELAARLSGPYHG